MPQCPNCSYKLVFLEKRLRYKCAKCGRVFLQKLIENRDFRIWNNHRRTLEKQELELEIKQLEKEKQKRNELRQLNKIGKALRLLFNGPKIRLNLTPEERKLRKMEYNKKWNENNPEKVRAMRRRQLENHREQRYAYLKAWRMSNLDKSRLKQRLTHWRRQQVKIAQKELRFNGYIPNTNGLDDSFSTFGLSDQLRKEEVSYILGLSFF